MPEKGSFVCSSNDCVHRKIAGSVFVQRRVVSSPPFCSSLAGKWRVAYFAWQD